MSANRPTWNSERIELLKRHFNAGLSCSQIAGEIGVTRNAVIGKMNRLGLSRPRDLIAAQQERRHAAGLLRARAPGISATGAYASKAWHPKRARVNIFAQHEMLAAEFPQAQPHIEDVPIANGCGCTLLELGQEKCRWPIDNPGAADFRFCGSEPVKGLPYCLGHARIAYRPGGRRRNAVAERPAVAARSMESV